MASLFVAVLHECFFEDRIVCFLDGLGVFGLDGVQGGALFGDAWRVVDGRFLVELPVRAVAGISALW